MKNADFRSDANRPREGLNAVAAAQRLATDGPNELPGHGPRSLAHITREVLTEPMFLLLLAAAAIYVVLGDLREALVLAGSILIIILITVFQERRTEHALARLRDLSSPRALVIRDGVETRIAGREVVRGDLLLLREGDRVPADGVLRSSTALSVDESILTGESLPVDKHIGPSDSTDTSAHVYSGSLVVRGYAVAEVTATGARSEIGKIGHALTTLTAETTPLFREVRRIVRWVASAGVLLCAAIAVFYGASRHDWLGGVLAGITVAMGVLPEEFPVVLTVFLAMGAWRISRAGVLTRRMPAIESIGAVTVLAVDKTGTLTENRMRVALLETLNDSIDLRTSDQSANADLFGVLGTALGASEQDAFDPMERAIHESAEKLIPDAVARLQRMTLVREYDLTPALLAVTHVWQDEGQKPLTVTVKGAPETVLELCKVADEPRARLLERVASHARNGLRVLAVASGQHGDRELPPNAHGFELQLLGLLCLADPLRSDVPDALATCTRAGVRVVMITGDHPGTALAIARQAGFDTAGEVLTGAQVETMDEITLCRHARSVNVFARMRPEQKLRLVQAFKANGEIIAMTGDGVNDAPALKAAHIGVAMGARGTDVAREAASIVLVNDDFGSLVGAVRLGRRIYDNIRHAMTFIVAVHIPIAGMGLLPVLFGWPLLFFPLHVLFLEFVIDPACAFVFEADPESPDIMQRKPRRPDARLFSRATLTRSVTLGSVALLFCAAVYGVALPLLPEPEARALSFIALVGANLALIFVSRSRSQSFAAVIARPNRIYWWITGATLAALCIVVYVPSVAALFRFSAPAIPLAIVMVLFGVVIVIGCGLAQRTAPPAKSAAA